MLILRFFDRILNWKPLRSRPAGSKKSSVRRREVFNDDRHSGSRQSVPHREIIIAVIAGMNLVVLPWCYGGIDLRAQYFSLAVSATAFAFLFLPVGYDEWRSVSAMRSLERVVRSVPFWAGLFLVAYMLLQGANPYLETIYDGNWWVPMPVDAWIRWLPHGVAAPMTIAIDTKNNPGGMNAFREALVFAPMWLTFVALSCGIRSRRVVVWLVRVMLASLVVLAVFAIGMRAAGETEVYGRIAVASASWYGPFGYQNQAGAFFTMGFLLAAGMALRQWRRSAARGIRGGEYLLMAAVAVLLAGAAVFSRSFGSVASVVVGLLVLVPLTWLAVREAKRGDSAISIPALVVGVTLIVSLALCVVFMSDLEPVWHKLMAKFDLMKTDRLDDREPIRAATWDMFMYPDYSRVFGIGAGAYRWLSPEFFSHYPQFRSGGRLWQASYAHCDWLQMLAEWGVLGVTGVVALVGWSLRELVRLKIWRTAYAFVPAIACLMFAAHAWIDFLFYSPALNLLFAFTAFVALFWAKEPAPKPRSRIS